VGIGKVGVSYPEMGEDNFNPGRFRCCEDGHGIGELSSWASLGIELLRPMS